MAADKAWIKFTEWLYLPDGLVPIISRLVGLISLQIGYVVWLWTHAGCALPGYPQPFNVPTWRFGTYLLPLPLPPEPVNLALFSLFALASVFLIAGKGARPIYIYMASVLAYYASREFFVCCLHWVLLDFLFLVALSFRSKEKNGRSPTRRLIQITLCTCYLFGALQKLLYPDFWQGISLEATFYDGYAVTAGFKDLFVKNPLPMSVWCAGSIFLILAETFIGIGLFFKRTRIAACVLGLALHGGIIVMMEWVLVAFSIEMWTGYLAFFDGPIRQTKNQDSADKKEQDASAAGQEQALAQVPTLAPGSQIKTALSLAFIALMILMPLRIYYLPGPPSQLLTLFERTPWGFGMFLMRQKVERLDIAFDDKEGKTHNLPATGRMLTASNDNELLSIAAYILKTNREAKSIRINDLIVVNEKRLILRTLIWDNPAAPASSPKITCTSAGDYCRGAANRNPDSDHRP